MSIVSLPSSETNLSICEQLSKEMAVQSVGLGVGCIFHGHQNEDADVPI